MDCSATLFSPSSSPPSTTFTSSSPLPSPRASSSPNDSFSFSPHPLTTTFSSARPDENSSLWDSPQPLRESFLSAQPPPLRPRRPLAAAAAATSPARRTHYSLLDVPTSATPAEIRVAYRKLALVHHPDVSSIHQGPAATRIFAEINEAYTTLTDPQKRQNYDLQLALGQQASSPRFSKSASASPRCSTSSSSTSPRYAASPREYTDAATGRVYPSVNSFYREWRDSRRV